MFVQYTLGTHSFTPFLDIQQETVMERQLKLSFPLITSVKFLSPKNKKQIYVGKEIALEQRSIYYWLEKYDLVMEDISDLYLQGYKKACLLNYKKYDSIIVGLNEEDEVVTDYYALKQRIREMKEGI